MVRVRAALILAACCALVGCTNKERGAAGSPPLKPSELNPAVGPQSEAALRDPRARIFLTKGCPQCHSISELQVTSPSNAGPDLALAWTDVHSRFGTDLPTFLHNPTGTMQIVLSAQIQLSPAERDSIAKLLHEINEAKTHGGKSQ